MLHAGRRRGGSRAGRTGAPAGVSSHTAPPQHSSCPPPRHPSQWLRRQTLPPPPCSPDADCPVPHGEHAAHAQRAAVPVHDAADAGARLRVACGTATRGRGWELALMHSRCLPWSRHRRRHRRRSSRPCRGCSAWSAAPSWAGHDTARRPDTVAARRCSRAATGAHEGTSGPALGGGCRTGSAAWRHSPPGRSRHPARQRHRRRTRASVTPRAWRLPAGAPRLPVHAAPEPCSGPAPQAAGQRAPLLVLPICVCVPPAHLERGDLAQRVYRQVFGAALLALAQVDAHLLKRNARQPGRRAGRGGGGCACEGEEGGVQGRASGGGGGSGTGGGSGCWAGSAGIGALTCRTAGRCVRAATSCRRRGAAGAGSP